MTKVIDMSVILAQHHFIGLGPKQIPDQLFGKLLEIQSLFVLISSLLFKSFWALKNTSILERMQFGLHMPIQAQNIPETGISAHISKSIQSCLLFLLRKLNHN